MVNRTTFKSVLIPHATIYNIYTSVRVYECVYECVTVGVHNYVFVYVTHACVFVSLFAREYALVRAWVCKTVN